MPNRPPRSFIAAVAAVAGMAAVAAISGSGASCTRKDDASKPAGIPSSMAENPSATVPAPMPPPTGGPALTPPPHAMPPAQPEAPAQAEAPAQPEAPIDPKAAISGTIELPAARRADVTPSDVVFLVARRIADNPTARGTLVAVKRLSAASFPIPFTLSARDMMIPTGAFDGEVSLTVRVDKDGDPMTRRKGDVLGSLPKVSVGARGVKLSLNQVQKEDESLAGSGPMTSPHAGMPAGHP